MFEDESTEGGEAIQTSMRGLDVFSEKDSKGETWTWLSVLCQGTTFQVAALLGDTHANPIGATEILEALNTHWFAWAGYPERGVMTDRARYFLADVAEDIASHGCILDTSATASLWQIWAALCDDSEVARVGAQALSGSYPQHSFLQEDAASGWQHEKPLPGPATQTR